MECWSSLPAREAHPMPMFLIAAPIPVWTCPVTWVRQRKASELRKAPEILADLIREREVGVGGVCAVLLAVLEVRGALCVVGALGACGAPEALGVGIEPGVLRALGACCVLGGRFVSWTSRPVKPSAMITGMPTMSGVKPWLQAKRRWSIELDRLPTDRKSTRLNSSHVTVSRMPSSA